MKKEGRTDRDGFNVPDVRPDYMRDSGVGVGVFKNSTGHSGSGSRGRILNETSAAKSKHNSGSGNTRFKQADRENNKTLENGKQMAIRSRNSKMAGALVSKLKGSRSKRFNVLAQNSRSKKRPDRSVQSPSSQNLNTKMGNIGFRSKQKEKKFERAGAQNFEKIGWGASQGLENGPVLPDNISFKQPSGLKKVKTTAASEGSVSSSPGVFGSLCSNLINRYNSFIRVGISGIHICTEIYIRSSYLGVRKCYLVW